MKTLQNISFLILVSILFVHTSCKKASEEDAELVSQQKTRNEIEIQQYIATNNLQMNKTASGLYYSLQGDGSGAKPDTAKNFIYLKYTSRVIPSGRIVDSNYIQTGNKKLTAIINAPTGTITTNGLLEGLKLMSKGQKAILLMNNEFAYGAGVVGNPFIPAYSAVRIDVDLIDVKSDYDFLTDYIQEKGYTDLVEKNTTRVTKLYSDPMGAAVKDTSSKVRINYVGRLATTGQIFESKQNVTFNLNTGLIQGFKDGLTLLRVEEQGVIMIPYRKGYGAAGSGTIPPYTPLIFEVTVLGLN